MLVGGLKVEVGRAAEFRVGIENGDVRGAGIDPDVKGVAALCGAFGKAEKGGEVGVGFLKPNVRSFFFDEVGDLPGEVGGNDGSAVLVKEDRKWNPPGALA